ncbi:MAG: PA0069 family radical SAM protein [Planctomycetota bacterium]
MPKPIQNPPNPFESRHIEWLGPPPAARVQVFEEQARQILSENDSPDLPFRWSLNPYRGCFHACSYCYARRTHEYLGFGAGSDFESRIVVKVNAVERLRASFEKKSWRGEVLALSGNTDCYQPLEACYELTRGILEVCRDYRNPVEIVTKGALIRRDIDVLRELSELAFVRVWISLAFANPAMARAMEPQAPGPRVRLEAIEALASAGIRVGVITAPLIPGLNDSDVPEILERARRAGASAASTSLLRLPGNVMPVFLDRLRVAFPDRAEKVQSLLRQEHGGELRDSRFGFRGTGEGERWRSSEQLFRVTARRLGFDGHRDEIPNTFRRPGPKQALLFE